MIQLSVVYSDKNLPKIHARVAELADALASGASDSNIVQVQPLSRAPSAHYKTQGPNNYSLYYLNQYCEIIKFYNC